MNTDLADIYEKGAYANILFSIWNEPKTAYKLAEDLIKEDIEHVIIKCPKCKQNNIFHLIKKLKKSSNYVDVDYKEIDGIQRFRKFIKKNQRCKKLYNNKRCRSLLLKYKKLKKIMRLQNIEDISYDFLTYADRIRIKTTCTNLKKNQLKRLEELNFIKITSNNSLCSINWKHLTNSLFYHLILKINSYLSEREINETRIIARKEFTIDLKKTKKEYINGEIFKVGRLSKILFNNLDKEFLINLIKNSYKPYLKYRDLNEFIEWFILSLGQWESNIFINKFTKYYNIQTQEEVKEKIQGKEMLFKLQRMCYEYKYKKERAFLRNMSLNLFEEYE